MRYRQSEQLNITPLEVVENTPQTLVALAFEPRGGGLNRWGKWFEPVLDSNIVELVNLGGVPC